MGMIKKFIRKYPVATVIVTVVVSSSAIGLTYIAKAKSTALNIVNGGQA